MTPASYTPPPNIGGGGGEESEPTMRFKGPWSADVAYALGDVVVDGNEYYVCKEESVAAGVSRPTVETQENVVIVPSAATGNSTTQAHRIDPDTGAGRAKLENSPPVWFFDLATPGGIVVDEILRSDTLVWIIDSTGSGLNNGGYGNPSVRNGMAAARYYLRVLTQSAPSPFKAALQVTLTNGATFAPVTNKWGKIATFGL